MKSLLLLVAVGLFMANPACAKTVYTGDRIDGARVIDKLDIADLPTGRTELWFRALDSALGQAWYVPVIVLKGSKPGPRLLLTAGIHGDELNGIAVIQALAQQLNPSDLSGAVVAVPGLNTPGLLHSTRTFSAGHTGSGGNLNRLIPSDPTATQGDTDASGRYAARLWSQLFIGNADLAIDMHTQSRGGAYPAYVFAQTGAARHIADMLRPDVINMDPGVEGSVENMLNGAGIAAVTYELGTAESWDQGLIDRARAGIIKVMSDAGMLPVKTATDGSTTPAGPNPFVGNETYDVTSPRGGWAHVRVRLNEDIKAGDILATVTNAFGDTVATLTAPYDAHVLDVAVDPRTDPGDNIVRLIRWNDALPCKADGCPSTAAMVKGK